MSEAEVQPSTETVEPAGLDAIIDSALDKSGYGEDAPVAPVTTEIKADTPAEAKDDHPSDPTRYADGTFKPTKPAEAEPSVTEPAKAEATPAETITPQPLATEPLAAPARWSDADKAKFAALPREAQEIVLERNKAIEGDYTRKTQELAETRKGFEPVVGEIQRLNPLLQHMGMTPQQFIAESGAVASNLLSGNPRDRAGAIAYLVQHRQVPIPELLTALGVPTSQTGEVQADPVIPQLHQKVVSLETQLRQMNERSVTLERERAQAEFDALGQAKDQNGQAKFPHFQRAKQTMIQLVASGQADTWDNAYAKAVRLDDELFKQTVEAERASVAAEAEKQRLAAVDKANKAKPVKSSDGSPKGASQLKGLDAHISGAMERAGLN